MSRIRCCCINPVWKIENDAKIPDVWGGGQSAVVEVEAEVSGGSGEGCGTNDDDIRFVTVQLEVVSLQHVGDGFGGDVQLDIVNIAVEPESVVMDDFAKGEHV